MIALLFRKWPVNLIAHLTVCPASVLIVLWKPLVFGDLDLVMISALAHNIRVLSLDRRASVRATALSLAIIWLDIANFLLSAGKRQGLSVLLSDRRALQA